MQLTDVAAAAHQLILLARGCLLVLQLHRDDADRVPRARRARKMAQACRSSFLLPLALPQIHGCHSPLVAHAVSFFLSLTLLLPC